MVYTEDGNIKLDHALNITAPALSSSFEKYLNKALKSFERACYDISHSITLVGYAAAAYLVMAGVSKLMEARNKRLPPPYPYPPPPYPDYQRKNKKRNKKKNGKGTENDAKEEYEETQEWELENFDNIP